MASASGTFTAAQQLSDRLLLRVGEQVLLTLTPSGGTWKVSLVAALGNPPAGYAPLKEFTSTQSGYYYRNTTDAIQLLALKCESVSGGTVAYTIADVAGDQVLREDPRGGWYDASNRLVAYVSDQGFVGPAFTASANVEGASTDADGATNRAALIAAIDRVQAAGGGRVTLSPGTYLIAGSSTRSLVVPINGANYASTAENLAAHFHVVEPTDLHFDMPGVTLQSAESGFSFFVFDGARNVRIDIGRILTPTAGQVGNSVLDVEGLNAFAFTSSTRDSWNIHIPKLHVDHAKTGIYIFGDAASSYRVRGVKIGTIRHEWGSYGVALHNNGDDVVVDSYVSSYVGRPGFFYGVDGVRGNWHNLQRLGGLSFLIKTYDRDTRNVDISYRIVTQNVSVPGLGMESEHHTGTPKTLRHIRVRYDDTDSTGGGLGIRFRYLVDGAETTPCATTLFDGIYLSGVMYNSTITSTVVQSTPGLLSLAGLLVTGAAPDKAIYASAGFYELIGGVRHEPLVGRGVNLGLQSATSTDTTQYGEVTEHRGSSAATTLIIGQYLRTGTVAASFTNTLLHTLRLANPSKGSGSTITKAVGLFIEDMDAGTTNVAIEAVDPISAGGVVVTAAATTQSAGVLSIGNSTQSTVGAAGGASALPATPTGYIKIYIGSTQFVIPYYAQA